MKRTVFLMHAHTKSSTMGVAVCLLKCSKGFLYYLHFTFSRRFYPKRLTGHSGYTFSLVCVFPGNRTHNLLRCWRNALPLSHRNICTCIIQICIISISASSGYFKCTSLFEFLVLIHNAHLYYKKLGCTYCLPFFGQTCSPALNSLHWLKQKLTHWTE